MLSLHLSKHHVLISTIASIVVLVLAMAIFADDRLQKVRQDSRAAVERSLFAAEIHTQDFFVGYGDLDVALQHAGDILVASRGKTLDEAAREQLTSAIAAAKANFAVQAELNSQLAELIRATQADLKENLRWPPNALESAQRLDQATGADADSLLLSVSALGVAIKAVQDAQAAWQAEQDRLAAEKAAAEAAAAAAEAARRKATPPSIPAAPSSSLPTVPGFNVEGYILALAPNAYVSWVPSLCDAYYLCGRAWIGGTNTTPVKIELDPAKADLYSNRVGRAILVHEAAHARQWLAYGTGITQTSEAQSGLSGTPAIEYMADCATIVKIGYSGGAYTLSCTDAQKNAIVGIW
jgi:hypothetical protein